MQMSPFEGKNIDGDFESLFCKWAKDFTCDKLNE